jgi:hypothetical protein
MFLSRISLTIMLLYSSTALATPFYKKCSFINSKESSFDLIVDISKKIVILHGDKTAGVFMIEDNEIGRACDNEILPCGSFASNLNGGILGKHTVTVEKDKIFFSAQSLGEDKLYNAYDVKSGFLLFGAIAMSPAYCVSGN